MNQLNLFDWFLVAILAWSTIAAFIRGFIREVFALCGLIAGISIASWNYRHAARLFDRLITTPSTAEITAFLLIVVSVMVLSTLLGRLLNRTAHVIGLVFFDRLLGAVFGLLRGCLLGGAILMAIAAFMPKSQWVANSKLSSCFLAAVHVVSFVVPHDLQQQITDGAVQLKHNAPDWIKPQR